MPEFSDRVAMPCAYGKTRDEAIRNDEEVIELYLDAWQSNSEPISEPKTLHVV